MKLYKRVSPSGHLWWVLSLAMVGFLCSTATHAQTATAYWSLNNTNGQQGTYFNGQSRISGGTVMLSGTSGLTLSAWINPSSFSGYSREGRIISKARGIESHEHSWMLSLGDNGSALRFRVDSTSGGVTTLISKPNLIRTNQWTHVAATYSRATMKLYIDGALVASTPKTGAVIDSATQSVAIGNQPSGAGDRGFIGRISNASVFSRALNNAEVIALMKSGTSQATSEPITAAAAAPAQSDNSPATSTTTSNGWPSNADGSKQHAGIFYGVAKGGITIGNTSIAYEHSRRFRATKSGDVVSVSHHNRLVDLQNDIINRCDSDPGSDWCVCRDNNLNENQCGYILGGSYHVGNGGSIIVELRENDGTSFNGPSSRVLGKTRTPFIPIEHPNNGVVELEFESPVNLRAGQIYHLVYKNLNPPPSYCKLTRNSPSQAKKCPVNSGAISLNGAFASEFAPAVGGSAGLWGPFFGRLGNENYVKRTLTDGWETGRQYTSNYSLKYSDGQDVGDFNRPGYVGGHTGEEIVEGNNVARQVFRVNDESPVVNGLWLSLGHKRKTTQNNTKLSVALKNSQGSTLATGSIGSSQECINRSFESSFRDRICRYWGYTNLNRTVTLERGSTYYLEFSSTSGAGFSLPTTFAFDENDRDAWPDAYAQISSNKGSSWSAWSEGYLRNRDIVALFTRSGLPKSLP